jgi:putative Mn2+ efflux pump MntP
MAHQTAQIHDKISDGALTSRIGRNGLALGVLGLLIACALGALEGDHMRRFFFGYLTAFSWVLSIALGGLFFVIIQHLTNAHWSVTVRRIAEFTIGAFPWIGLMAVPLFYPLFTHHGVEEFGGLLWPWIHPHGEHAALVAKKVSWLNANDFALRLAFYIVLWSGMSRFFLKQSLIQDDCPDFKPTQKAKKWSALSVIIFALSTSFAAFDIIMSMAPEWFSTIFGVYYFSGATMVIMAWLILAGRRLQNGGVLTSAITPEHYHDLGKFMFAFVFFWAYIAFSQFMLIWYANIPEETGWFMIRRTDAWMPVTWALVIFHFAVPFLGLLSRHPKRNLGAITFWAGYLMVLHWIDMVWLIMPQYSSETLPIGLMEIGSAVGLLGFFVWAVARTAGDKPLLPRNDALLGESLAFRNT